MTDVPWTPGPWVVRDERDTGGELLIIRPAPNGGILDNLHIARPCLQGPETMGNAHVLAEAPAMAEALKQMLRSLEAKLRQYEEWDGGAHPTSPIGNARAILARIKGTTP